MSGDAFTADRSLVAFAAAAEPRASSTSDTIAWLVIIHLFLIMAVIAIGGAA